MKKRLSALFVAICLMVTCLPFSAIVSADTPVNDGVVGYIVKAPADKDSAASGDLASDALHDAAGQALTVRHENGENFFVIDEAISTKGNTAKDVAVQFYAEGMNAAGLPNDIAIKDDSVIAIRVKFNENSAAYDANKAAFRVYLAAKGGAVEEDYSNRANTVIDITNSSMWLDLEDATYTKFFPANGEVVAENTTGDFGKQHDAYPIEKFELKGDMDGYMILPLKLFGDAYTAEQVMKNFTSIIIAPFVTNANDDDHKIEETPTDTATAYTLRDRELLIGDIAVVNDIEAFKAAKTAGMTKYATGLDDGAYYAQNNRAYRTMLGNRWSTYVIPEFGKNGYRPLKANTGYTGYLHLTTLPNGDMAYAVQLNAGKTIGTGRNVYTSNLDTFEGVNVDGGFSTTEKGFGKNANYAAYKGVVPTALGITKDTGFAYRVALTGNEDKTVYIAFGQQSGIDSFNYLTIMPGAEITYVDANTGERRTYTVQDENPSADGIKRRGIGITGNVDGYFILPNISKTYYHNCGSHADPNSLRGVQVMLTGGEVWNQGQTLYLGDAYYLSDVEKFITVRTSCDMLGHDFQTETVTAPNCTEPKKYNQKCTRCDATQVITEGEALGHTWGTPTTVEANCTEGGYDLYECTVEGCGVEKKDNEVAALGHGHEYGFEENVVEPGPHTPGSTETICNDCYAVVKQASVIEPTCKETETKVVGVKDATCKEDGYTGDTVCVACETVLEKGKVEPKLAHTEKTVGAKDATCKEAGYTGDKVCEVCKEVVAKGEEIKKLAHTEKTINAKDATCEEEGYTGDVVCDVCDEEIKKGEATAKLDHTYGDWEETKAPTATEKGEKERECSACGDVEKAEIPATGTDNGDGNDNDGNAGKPGSPITGENNSILWVVLMALTAGAVLTVVAKKRCK